MNLRRKENAIGRRRVLERHLEIDLSNIGSFTLDEKTASLRNCENMIGAVQIPVGIAGPLRIRSDSAGIGKYFVPLATTEGALVASVSRGCKAITRSGGAAVNVERIGATRGPVFVTDGIKESLKFAGWLARHFKEIDSVSKKTSSHIKLLKIEPKVVGKYVFVRFAFDTDKAMGMNMATFAVEAIAKYVESKTGVLCLSLSGNYCLDKKPSWLNFTKGRGYEVNAEVTVKESVIKTVLKTSSRKIYKVWLAKCMTGSAISGSMGFNAQFGNVVAAFFLATGQDLAHIAEGSMGITTMETVKGGLYVNVHLPDLMMGTVGGGTSLATQKEALSIMGTKNIPEILAAAVLAGEISLLASLAEGSLARAHMRLAR